MYVFEKMSANPVTVEPKYSLSKAFQIMTDSGHSRLPVTDSQGKLLGIVTEKLLAEVNPSKATSLSVYEINYLLSKTKVADVMKTGIFKIKKDRLIEDAALVIKENHIGSLPVVDEDDVLVGIITRTDIFKAFINIMGVKLSGYRVVLSAKEDTKISEIVNKAEDIGVRICCFSDFRGKDKNEIILKLECKNADSFTNAVKSLGYEIISVSREQ